MTDPLPPSLAANPRLDDWLDFSARGLVTVRPGKVEYGQGVWTALAQIAAEELDVRLDQVRIAPVSTATSPDEGVTSGSRSIEDSGGALHWVCAQARAALLAAAAARLETAPATLSVRGGEVRTAAGGTGLSYWSWMPRPARPGRRARGGGQAAGAMVGRRAQRAPHRPAGQGHRAPAVPARPGAAGHAVRPGGPAARRGRHAGGGPGPGPTRPARRPRCAAGHFLGGDRGNGPGRGRGGGTAGPGRPVDGARLAARRAGPEGLPAGRARAGAAGGAAP